MADKKKILIEYHAKNSWKTPITESDKGQMDKKKRMDSPDD